MTFIKIDPLGSISVVTAWYGVSVCPCQVFATSLGPTLSVCMFVAYKIFHFYMCVYCILTYY